MLPRLLAVAMLTLLGVSFFVPTHTLDHVMLMTDGYLWGSKVDMGGRPLLDLVMVLQPLMLLVIALACLSTLRTGRTRTLLVAAGAFQAALLMTGLHAWAIDGGSWRGSMPRPFFDVLQVVCVLFLIGATVAHHRRPATTAGSAQVQHAANEE
ncbi:MAG: hypothetical protein JNM69_23115 [Archangium sp.]|nr:hypothetical protein [Archangium sp.]